MKLMQRSFLLKKISLLFLYSIVLLFLFLFILEFIFSKIDSFSSPHIKDKEINLLNRFINLREHPINQQKSFKVSKFRSAQTPSLRNRTFKYNTDDDGFLIPGNRHVNPEFKIFFLGGSTTENLLVEEKNRFTYIFEKTLEKQTKKKINVYNSGRSKNNSMHSLNILINKIIKLNPTHVFLMHNINDYFSIIEFKNKSLFDEFSDLERNLLTQPVQKKKWNYLRFRSLFFNNFPNLAIRIQLIKNRFAPSMAKEKYSKTKMISEEDIEYFFEEKIKILKIYNEISKNFNFHLILITQPQNYENYREKDFLLKEIDLRIKLHKRTNEMYRKFAKDNNLNIVELSDKFDDKNEYFYDIIHYNDKGSQEIAKEISKNFKNFFN